MSMIFNDDNDETIDRARELGMVFPSRPTVGCTCNHPVVRHETCCTATGCTCTATREQCAKGDPFRLNNTDLFTLRDALGYYLTQHPKFASMRNEDLWRAYQEASDLERRIKDEIGRRETGR